MYVKKPLSCSDACFSICVSTFWQTNKKLTKNALDLCLNAVNSVSFVCPLIICLISFKGKTKIS